MRLKLFFFLPLLTLLLFSCNSHFKDFGDGFSLGWKTGPTSANIFYNNTELIDTKTAGAVKSVKWDAKWVMAETKKGKYFRIEKAKAKSNPYSPKIAVTESTFMFFSSFRGESLKTTDLK